MGGAEELVNEAKTSHEHARREKKSAFANFFAGACAVLSEEAPADAGDSTEWRRVCVGRTHAIGRLHRNEFSLETVEMVAEGSDVAESVQAEVFGPLRKLEACCG